MNMVDKDLFLHDLSVVAILKNEAPYLQEWLDYHLIAGVDYFHAPGAVMQMPVYNDAVKRFKFQSRYMAFIDGDEFIYPKSRGGVIVDVVDEILADKPNAAGLAINWQMFGSNGQDKADYSRGVLERFTRRAPIDDACNHAVKTIANPRKIYFIYNPHCARYFEECYPVNENGNAVTGRVPNAANIPVTAEKIAVNHYYVKSREEYLLKMQRGRCDQPRNDYSMKIFKEKDRNDEFDDGILHYRAARAENFSLESGAQRLERVTEALTDTLAAYGEGAKFSLETALTCRAVSTYLREKFPGDADSWRICETASLAAILKSCDDISLTDARLLVLDLPNLLRLPYPAVKEILPVAKQILSRLINHDKMNVDWRDFFEMSYINDLLKIGG